MVAESFTTEDLRRFLARMGDPAFIAIREALAILVALRRWLRIASVGCSGSPVGLTQGTAGRRQLASPSLSLNMASHGHCRQTLSSGLGQVRTGIAA